jgi:hypothetical protein
MKKDWYDELFDPDPVVPPERMRAAAGLIVKEIILTGCILLGVLLVLAVIGTLVGKKSSSAPSQSNPARQTLPLSAARQRP